MRQPSTHREDNAHKRRLTKRREAAIAAELEKLQVLRDHIKDRSILYQADWKERQATAEGKELDFYYHMAYIYWDKVRDSRYQ